MSWSIENAPKPKRITVFGHFVRMRRSMKGLTQKQVSNAVGYLESRGTCLSQAETGRVVFPRPRLTKLAEILDVNLFQLKQVYDLDLEIRARAS